MDFFERKGKKPTTKTTGGAGVGKSVTEQWTQPILFTVLVFCFFFFFFFYIFHTKVYLEPQKKVKYLGFIKYLAGWLQHLLHGENVVRT